MSEEIIIDGVNVAECVFFDKNATIYNCIEDTVSGDGGCYICKNEPNCYFKQLKRLQAENKENLHYLACMTEQRNKLKIALEEIREIAKEIDDVDKWIEQDLMPTQVCERIEKIKDKINEVLDERN